MPYTPQVVVNHRSDCDTIATIGWTLRSHAQLGQQIRDFAETVDEGKLPKGVRFHPNAGQLLLCHFGIGFQRHEIVKNRPVIVISPKPHEWTGLCTVVPISHIEPRNYKPYHYRLPENTVPNSKYRVSWIKGDLVQTVGLHRMDRIHLGGRKFDAPYVGTDILREARRCALHALGLKGLTDQL